MICPMTRRGMALITVVAACAVLIGGVTQTYAWRWGIDPVTQTTNTQFAWILLCFIAAWAWAQGRVPSGIIAGGLTGAGLIGSYYVVQWLADGRHAAVSQFSSSSGLAWVVAAIGGGALFGGLGGLAGRSATEQSIHKALGLTVTALVVGLGPLVWLVVDGRSLQEDDIWAAITFYGVIGVVLGAVAARSCGTSSFLRGLGLATVCSSVALLSLLLLQRTVLYTTF